MPRVDPAAPTDPVTDNLDPSLPPGATTGEQPTTGEPPTTDAPPTGEPTTIQAASETGKTSGGDRPPEPGLTDQIDEGCRLVRAGDAARGLETLLKAHDRKVGDLRVLHCLADGYYKLGNYKSAANFYERMLSGSGRNRIGLLGAAQSYEALNQRVVAGTYYQRLLSQEPRNPSARAFFAEEFQLKANP